MNTPIKTPPIYRGQDKKQKPCVVETTQGLIMTEGLNVYQLVQRLRKDGLKILINSEVK